MYFVYDMQYNCLQCNVLIKKLIHKRIIRASKKTYHFTLSKMHSYLLFLLVKRGRLSYMYEDGGDPGKWSIRPQIWLKDTLISHFYPTTTDRPTILYKSCKWAVFDSVLYIPYTPHYNLKLVYLNPPEAKSCNFKNWKVN